MLPTVTQSKLENAKCLHRFHELYILGVKEPMNEYADRGIQLHRLHKLYVDYLVHTDQPYDYDYAESLCERPDMALDAIRLFRQWYQRSLFNPRVIYGTEIKIQLDGDFRPCVADYRYSGEMDRLEIEGEDALIVDLKTHFGVFEPDTIQAMMYPWLLRKAMPWLKRIRFELHFVRWNIVRARDFEAEEIDELEKTVILKLVERLHAAESDGMWPAIANTKCSICSLECPLVADGIRREQIGQIDTPELAAALAGQLYAMEKQGDKLQSMLKAYCIERGPISMDNGIVLGFQRRTSQDYSVRDTIQLNEKHGFDPHRALSVDNQAVKKIGKRYPEYKAALEKSKQDNSTTAFAFRNKE